MINNLPVFPGCFLEKIKSLFHKETDELKTEDNKIIYTCICVKMNTKKTRGYFFWGIISRIACQHRQNSSLCFIFGDVKQKPEILLCLQCNSERHAPVHCKIIPYDSTCDYLITVYTWVEGGTEGVSIRARGLGNWTGCKDTVIWFVHPKETFLFLENHLKNVLPACEN